MSSELRYIMFTEKEIAEAAVGYLAHRSAVAPGAKNAKPKVETLNPSSLVVSYQKDEFGKRERRVFSSFEMIDALVSWCRAQSVMLPLSAHKDLVRIGKVICMRMALNVPEKNVTSVERLILAASTDPDSASAA